MPERRRACELRARAGGRVPCGRGGRCVLEPRAVRRGARRVRVRGVGCGGVLGRRCVRRVRPAVCGQRGVPCVVPAERWRGCVLRGGPVRERAVLVRDVVERVCVRGCVPRRGWPVLWAWCLRRVDWRVRVRGGVRGPWVRGVRGWAERGGVRRRVPEDERRGGVRGARRVRWWRVLLRSGALRRGVRGGCGGGGRSVPCDVRGGVLRCALRAAVRRVLGRGRRRRGRVQRARDVQRRDVGERGVPVRGGLRGPRLRGCVPA